MCSLRDLIVHSTYLTCKQSSCRCRPTYLSYKSICNTSQSRLNLSAANYSTKAPCKRESVRNADSTKFATRESIPSGTGGETGPMLLCIMSMEAKTVPVFSADFSDLHSSTGLVLLSFGNDAFSAVSTTNCNREEGVDIVCMDIL